MLALKVPRLTALMVVLFSVLAVWGVTRLKVDDSLSELFRTNTEEFRRYEEIDRRFPSSEYDVLVVVEGKDLLKKPQIEAFRRAIVDLQLADGVEGLVSMLSARGKPDASGYARRSCRTTCPTARPTTRSSSRCRANEIVTGKFLSPDGELALAVMALDRKAVEELGAKAVIGNLRKTVEDEVAPVGLTVQLTGAPVMQLEIRNAVERDQLLYNGLGLLFGAIIAVVFFRRVSLMLTAALPPVLAVLWSLGLLGLLDFKLNLFLNVMTPLVMVMGFADSMQMVSAIRIRLREGDTRLQAVQFAVKVVGPACVLAHGTAMLSFAALLFSHSGLIRTFGEAGMLAADGLVRRRHPGAAAARPAVHPQRDIAGAGARAGRSADGRPRHPGRLDRRPGGGAPAGDQPRRLRPVPRVRRRLPAARAALPPRRPGAGPRAGAGRHRPHRREADRRQPGAHHDRVEERRAAVFATSRSR